MRAKSLQSRLTLWPYGLVQYSGKGTGAGIKLQLCHLLWSWASHVYFWSLILLICKTRKNSNLKMPRTLTSYHILCVCMSVLSRVCLFVTPWTIAHQALLTMKFFQARIREGVAISYCKGFSPIQDRTCISCLSCTGRQILYHGATWEA